MRGGRVRHLPARERSVADSVRRMFAAIHLRPLLAPKSDLPTDDTGKPWGQVRLPEDRMGQVAGAAPPPAPSRTRGADHGNADLYAALNTLPPEEREVVRLSFGLEGGEAMTPDAIGIRLGLPEAEVRARLEAGLRHLHERLAPSK